MKLKNCPFCGRAMEWDDILIDKDSGYCVVFCIVCTAEGPANDTKKEAAKAWNKRVKGNVK